MIRELREEVDRKDRKLAVIPHLEAELARMRERYETEMKAKYFLFNLALISFEDYNSTSRIRADTDRLNPPE